MNDILIKAHIHNTKTHNRNTRVLLQCAWKRLDEHTRKMNEPNGSYET